MSGDAALLELLRYLKSRDYRFITVTPATHQRVLARSSDRPPTLRDILGWNRPFAEGEVDPVVLRVLDEAGSIKHGDDGWRSTVRVASLGPDLFVHSAFPTDQADAVFFGPDTYRFARFITDELRSLPSPARIVDMGTGSGAGGLFCARLMPQSSVTLVDINETALRLARVNAAAAGVEAEVVQADIIPAGADLIVSNPPYMIDAQRRAYRDGGDLLGGGLAVDWVRQALGVLNPGGAMLLYTGAAFVAGVSPAIEAMADECARRGARFSVREIDPDVFGEELDNPAYAEVERIAAVGCVVRRPN